MAMHPQVVVRKRRKARARSREGAVMLVVLLILLVATASAVVSVSNTQTELASAGNERVATQTRYVAEAAIVSSMALVDQLGSKVGGVLYRAQGTELQNYAEPDLVPLRWFGQITIENLERNRRTTEVTPLADAAPYVPTSGSGGGGGAAGTSAGSGGSGGGGPISDTTGSFGPQQSYALTDKAFTVQFTDCQRARGAVTVGESIGGSDPWAMPYQLNCTLTARGRLEPAGGSSETSWEFGSGGKQYNQRAFASAHDARAAILTPTINP